MRPSFTYLDGLKLQKMNLLSWENKLTNECYKALEFYTSEHNKSLLSHIEFFESQISGSSLVLIHDEPSWFVWMLLRLPLMLSHEQFFRYQGQR